MLVKGATAVSCPRYFISGFAYISVYKKFIDPRAAVYRPELADDIIWNGFITIDPYQPSGPEWDAFADGVVAALKDPMWASFPYVEANMSPDDVSSFAGNLCRIFGAHCLLGFFGKFNWRPWRYETGRYDNIIIHLIYKSLLESTDFNGC